MNYGKNFFTSTDTWPDNKVVLGISVKQRGHFSISDMAGTWNGYNLATNGSSGVWKRTFSTIDSQGTIRTDWNKSDGASGRQTSQLNISRTGIITVNGFVGFQGAMNCSKDIYIYTDTSPNGKVVLGISFKISPKNGNDGGNNRNDDSGSRCIVPNKMK